MSRILAIDYGQKRVGLAVTDMLQITANGLDTVPSGEIFAYIKDYCEREEVVCFLVGWPLDLKGQPAESMRFVEPFVKALERKYPDIPVLKIDERFTSKMAQQAILMSGISKKKRQDKGLIDKVSATIILQYYLDSRVSMIP